MQLVGVIPAQAGIQAAQPSLDPRLRGNDRFMPWNEDYYPPAMTHLAPPVRSKAIEIANALLEEGHDEGFCIRVAIVRAKEWGRRHGLVSDTGNL
jgi:hypothetical protein